MLEFCGVSPISRILAEESLSVWAPWRAFMGIHGDSWGWSMESIHGDENTEKAQRERERCPIRWQMREDGELTIYEWQMWVRWTLSFSMNPFFWWARFFRWTRFFDDPFSWWIQFSQPEEGLCSYFGQIFHPRRVWWEAFSVGEWCKKVDDRSGGEGERHERQLLIFSLVSFPFHPLCLRPRLFSTLTQ